MIITLVKADFSANNIGTLSSFAVLTNILNATYDGPTSVAKGEAFAATITAHDGYSITNFTVSMGGAVLDDAYTISGSVATINISEVTGMIVINMATETGEVVLTWTVDDGYALNSSGKYANENFATISLPVVAGQVYAFTAARNVMFYDADGNPTTSTVQHGWSTTQASPDRIVDTVFTAPENAASVSFCVRYVDVNIGDNMVTTAKADGSILVYEGVVLNGQFGTRTNLLPSAEVGTYFGFYGIPVVSGTTYNVPYLRNYCFYNSNKEQYTTTNLTGIGASNAQITVPDGYTLFCPCFKYSEIAPENITITIV